MILNSVEFDQESVPFSGDCCDTEGWVTDINHGESVYCLLLGHFKHSVEDTLSKWPQHLIQAEKNLTKDLPGQIGGAYSLVLVKVDGRSAYRRVGLLVHRGGSGLWEGAEMCDFLLV